MDLLLKIILVGFLSFTLQIFRSHSAPYEECGLLNHPCGPDHWPCCGSASFCNCFGGNKLRCICNRAEGPFQWGVESKSVVQKAIEVPAHVSFIQDMPCGRLYHPCGAQYPPCCSSASSCGCIDSRLRTCVCVAGTSIRFPFAYIPGAAPETPAPRKPAPTEARTTIKIPQVEEIEEVPITPEAPKVTEVYEVPKVPEIPSVPEVPTAPLDISSEDSITDSSVNLLEEEEEEEDDGESGDGEGLEFLFR